MFVRVYLIEVIGVEEGRVNAHGVNACGARHAHVVERVAEVGGFRWSRRVTERGEPTSKRRRIRLLLNRVVAVDGRTDEVGDPSTTELPSNHFAVTSGDDAEWDPRSNESLQRGVRPREKFCFVPLIGTVPDVRRTLNKVLGDAEGGVHAAPVR